MGGLPALVGASASRDGQAVSDTPFGHVPRKSRKNQKRRGYSIQRPGRVFKRTISYWASCGRTGMIKA